MTLKEKYFNSNYVLKTREGVNYLPVNDILLGFSGYMFQDSYNDDMVFEFDDDSYREYDIVAVFEFNETPGCGFEGDVKNIDKDKSYRSGEKPVWERPKSIDITIRINGKEMSLYDAAELLEKMKK